VTLHETKSVTGAPYNIIVTVCHTAEHYGEEYDDWNSAVFRSQRNCSSVPCGWVSDVVSLNGLV